MQLSLFLIRQVFDSEVIVPKMGVAQSSRAVYLNWLAELDHSNATGLRLARHAHKHDSQGIIHQVQHCKNGHGLIHELCQTASVHGI